MTKGYCINCNEWCDEVTMNSYGRSSYQWNGSDYEWYDAGDTEDDGPYMCAECGEEVEMREFVEKPKNEWKGNSR